MKKILKLTIMMCFLLGMRQSVYAAEVVVDGDIINTDELEGEKKKVYEAFAEERDAIEEICMSSSMYDSEAIGELYTYFQNTIMRIRKDGTPEITNSLVKEMKEKREKLIPIKEKSDVIWKIWGEDMPVYQEKETMNFSDAYDDRDFSPYICTYLVENQSQAKGNVLVCSGGADVSRNNTFEGFPACEFLRSIGYNAYLLNYRVAPYAPIDMTMDVQRAVRCLKYYGEERGIGSLDNIVTMGFSAGAMHCYGQAIAYSGAISPKSVYPDYNEDKIDKICADVDVCVSVYAAGMGHDTKGEAVDIKSPILILDGEDPNKMENLPSFFFAGASGHFASKFCVDAYQRLNPLTTCELHMYGNVERPFGIGEGYAGADQMCQQLETFLDVEFGYISVEE